MTKIIEKLKNSKRKIKSNLDYEQIHKKNTITIILFILIEFIFTCLNIMLIYMSYCR